MSEKQEYNYSPEKSDYDVPPSYTQHAPPPLVQSHGLADSYYSNSPNSSSYPAASSSYPAGSPQYSAGPSGYPSYSGGAGYPAPPPHSPMGGYPAQQSYPSQQGYPAQQGYPSQQGYALQQDYPGPSQSYSQQGAYPPFAQGDSGYVNGDRGHQQFGDHPELQVFSYNGTKPAKRDPFNPVPPSFSRQPSPGLPYPPLMEPLRIPAQEGANLSSGFVPLFPAPPLLLAHDVHPADNSRLLEDCHLVCQLGTGQRIGAQVAPMVMGIGFLPGIFVSRAIENRMKGKKVDDIAGLVDVWDEAFFAPRRLRLWIDHGRTHHGGRSKDDSSSSSSSSDDDARGSRRESRRERKEARREAKRERKEARRERKAERKAARKGGRHGGSAQRVYLVIGNR